MIQLIKPRFDPYCAFLRWSLRLAALVCWMACAARAVELTPTAEGLEFFEKKIRPLLAERCYKCHSAAGEKIKGGLRLDSREGLLQGGTPVPPWFQAIPPRA